MKNLRINWYLTYAFSLSGLIILIILLDLINPSLRSIFVKENGIIESLSVIGYFISIILLYFYYLKQRKKKDKNYWSITLILTVFALRELDFHNRFTTEALTRFRTYFNPEIPAVEKLIGLAIVFLFFYSIIYTIKTHFKDFFKALKEKRPYTFGILLGILFLFSVEVLDGLGRRLSSIGIVIGNNTDLFLKGVEEVLEFGIGLMFVLSILACLRSVKH